MLVEHPDPAVRDTLQSRLEAHGCQVVTCAGPRQREGEFVSCPLVQYQACPAVDGADVVVSALDLRSDDGGTIVTKIAGSDPERPVIVRTRIAGDIPQHLAEAANVHVLQEFRWMPLTRILDRLPPRA